MSDIKFIDQIEGKQGELDLAELVTLIKGSSITSMALSDNFFELGLSDAFNLRIQGQLDISISLMSTLNKGESPPVRLQIISDGEAPTAEAIEKRIHSLRQLYAMVFLTNAGRSEEFVRMLQANPEADLEGELLKEEEHLFVTAANKGSFWLTILTKSQDAFKSFSIIVPMFYDEGRQALLERVRATTELKKLDVKEKENDLAFRQANNFLELMQKIEKIKDPDQREKVREILSTSLHNSGKTSLSLPKPTTYLNSDK